MSLNMQTTKMQTFSDAYAKILGTFMNFFRTPIRLNNSTRKYETLFLKSHWDVLCAYMFMLLRNVLRSTLKRHIMQEWTRMSCTFAHIYYVTYESFKNVFDLDGFRTVFAHLSKFLVTLGASWNVMTIDRCANRHLENIITFREFLNYL